LRDQGQGAAEGALLGHGQQQRAWPARPRPLLPLPPLPPLLPLLPLAWAREEGDGGAHLGEVHGGDGVLHVERRGQRAVPIRTGRRAVRQLRQQGLGHAAGVALHALPHERAGVARDQRVGAAHGGDDEGEKARGVGEDEGGGRVAEGGEQPPAGQEALGILLLLLLLGLTRRLHQRRELDDHLL
jgi:hypothetical protein